MDISPGSSKLDCTCAGAAHAKEHIWTTENLCVARAKDDDSSIASAADALEGKAANLGDPHALGNNESVCPRVDDIHQVEHRWCS